MKCIAALASVFACSTALAAPTLTSHVPLPVATHSAQLAGEAAPDATMELAISLPLRSEPALRALVNDITDPSSRLYRHYLSVADFTARFGPTQADYDALVAFAAANHLHPRAAAANRRVLDVTGRVADIEQAFHITIGIYKHPTEARNFFAPDREPSSDLATPILHVSGLDDYVRPFTHLLRGNPAAQPHLQGTGSGPDGSFLGSDVRAAYYGGKSLNGAGQVVGLLEYAGYEVSDVQLYFSKVKQPLNVPIVGEALNGANLNCSGKCDDSEQVLDIEETISMSPGLQEVVVYVGKIDVSILNQMASDNLCRQLSSSWGWGADPATLDPIFLEFAAQGQSFVDATGDYGYHLLADAVWPGDDQFVTGVGGTDLVTSGPGGAWLSETGWHYSGGGPSPDHIAIPYYQVPFVTKANKGSTTLRNVPDIAGDANTNNYSCYNGGCSTGNGGTSYAAPLWAGFIALVNQQAALSGEPAVGFLNPRLYALGGSSRYGLAFHDETKGYNGRYYARTGFDLVTGFGSPRGDVLIRALIGD
jgi:xanthomonalisin